jgi:hypothetical protein
LIEDIGAGPVGLDTTIFIYLIEEHPRFFPSWSQCSRPSTVAAGRESPPG